MPFNKQESTPDAEFSNDALFLVPAGGYGTRLGLLTANQAKPSLPISYDDDGYVRRMVDVPLEAIRHIGGAAIVSLFYKADSLRVVLEYDHVTTSADAGPSSSIGTLLGMRELLERSRAIDVGIIPGDTFIMPSKLADLYEAHQESDADATLLATRHIADHNVHPVNGSNIMTTEDEASSHVADLGIHIINKGWLLDRLSRLNSVSSETDIWKDIYTTGNPAGDFRLHIPADDSGWVDMGTPTAYYRTLRSLNADRADRNDNVVFPGATINRSCSSATVALPNSNSALSHDHAILPEGAIIRSTEETVIIE